MITRILNNIGYIYSTVPALIFVLITNSRKSVSAVGTENITRKHCFALSVHRDLTLFFILTVSLLQNELHRLIFLIIYNMQLGNIRRYGVARNKIAYVDFVVKNS